MTAPDRDAVVREAEEMFRRANVHLLDLGQVLAHARIVAERAFQAGQAHERAAVVRFLDVFDCPDCHPDGPHYPCSSDSHALAEYDAISRGAHHTKGEGK